jgi:folate-dependent phosphoribosylglycinamide formyltransferase PurN
MTLQEKKDRISEINNEIYTLEYQPFVDWLENRKTKIAQKCLKIIEDKGVEFCVCSGYISVVARFGFFIPDYFTKQVKIFNKTFRKYL